MGFRELLDKHPKSAAAVAIFGIALLLWSVISPQRAPAVTAAQSAFFSDDDGQTYFRDDAAKIPPFDHGSKQAVAAHVFAGKNGKPFVGYLERATTPAAADQVRQARADMLTKARAQAVPMPDNELQGLLASRLEIKRPGDKTWVLSSDPRATSILNVTAPDGTPATPVNP